MSWMSLHQPHREQMIDAPNGVCRHLVTSHRLWQDRQRWQAICCLGESQVHCRENGTEGPPEVARPPTPGMHRTWNALGMEQTCFPGIFPPAPRFQAIWHKMSLTEKICMLGKLRSVLLNQQRTLDVFKQKQHKAMS